MIAPFVPGNDVMDALNEIAVIVNALDNITVAPAGNPILTVLRTEANTLFTINLQYQPVMICGTDGPAIIQVLAKGPPVTIDDGGP